jgi:hypothetical protein
MLGYPATAARFIGEQLSIDFKCVHLEGTVVQVYEQRRDRGMITFPCFEVDKPVDGGFSGGPVFWNGMLCGLVSSGSLTESTYVVSLWPMGLMTYEYPGIGGKTSFGNLLDSGTIRSTDWAAVKARISIRTDEDARDYAFIQ